MFSTFLVMGTSSASAHTVLVASNPAKGSTIRVVPTMITLRFADPLLTLGKRAINNVLVFDPHNSPLGTGKTLVRGALITVQLAKPATLKGKYRVTYRVAAQDGHIVTGSFTFTLQN